MVTGVATGRAASPEEGAAVKGATALPVAAGSGITPANVAAYAGADLLVAGSWLKRDGDWRNPPDEARVAALVEAVHRLRR